MEIKGEHAKLSAERAELQALLADKKKREKAIAKEVAEIQKSFGKDTPLGKRRTQLGAAPKEIVVPIEATIEREDITVVLSDKGWIRGIKGHGTEEFSFKEGDSSKFVLRAATTDKFLLLATNGRFYTLSGDKLPRGRGHGEPVRLMVDLPNDADIVTMFVFKPEQKLLVVSAEGRGLIAKSDDAIAQTRAGKQILNLEANEEAKLCVPADGDTVAIIGDNRKLLLFPLAEVPEQARGRGVILQRYKDKNGKVSDVQVFTLGRWTQLAAGGTHAHRKEHQGLGRRARGGGPFARRRVSAATRRRRRFPPLAAEVRRHDRDRFVTALFAPAERREALLALYAFNSEVARTREAISEVLLGEIRLQWWRDALDKLYAGTTLAHPVVEGLGVAVGAHSLSRALFDRLIDARGADLSNGPLASLAEMEDYADGTSATLLTLALETLDARGDGVTHVARHAGVGWGLVGLLRAVPFHARARAALFARRSADRACGAARRHLCRPQLAGIGDRGRNRCAAGLPSFRTGPRRARRHSARRTVAVTDRHARPGVSGALARRAVQLDRSVLVGAGAAADAAPGVPLADIGY